MAVKPKPGWDLSREIAGGETAEGQIDAFISRRDEQRRKSEPEREMEEVWKEAERRQEAARRAENRAGWRGWHEHRAELYARLSEEHRAKAEGLTKRTDERKSA